MKVSFLFREGTLKKRLLSETRLLVLTRCRSGDDTEKREASKMQQAPWKIRVGEDS
jgi:hypothetical protein